jgi:copper chaperone CopZ
MVEYCVKGMRCIFCAYRLRAAIRKIDPHLVIKIDIKTGGVGLEKQEDIQTVERAVAYLAELARS